MSSFDWRRFATSFGAVLLVAIAMQVSITAAAGRGWNRLTGFENVGVTVMIAFFMALGWGTRRV